MTRFDRLHDTHAQTLLLQAKRESSRDDGLPYTRICAGDEATWKHLLIG